MHHPRWKRLGFETLECRRMLAGDLFYDPGAPGSFDRIVFVGADGSEISVGDPAPVVGQKVYVAIDWSVVGLTGGDEYEVEFAMDGVKLAYPFSDPFSSIDYPAMYHGGWFAQPGETHTITITLDPHNTVAETNEANNTFSLQFTTLDPTSLTNKFATPLAGTQNVDWVLGGYVDVNPKVFEFGSDDVDFFNDYQGNTPTTRDFHNGLDFAIANFAAQDAGVEVLAAAGGTVMAVNDGEYDRETFLQFANLGNYVFIDHGNGWVSQYWHLREGSITVEVNDVVTAGQVLGLVGSSGNSGGPHLHFEIQHNKTPVDPFSAPDDYFVSPPPYVIDPVLPNNLLDFGVTNDIYDGVHTFLGPSFDTVREKVSDIDAFPSAPQEIYAWAIFTSVEAGDTWRALLYRPDGTLVNDYSAVMFTQPTDFQEDGDTDGDDFLAWQRGFGINGGASHSDGDANFNGVVDGTDLALWELQYGKTAINGWEWGWYRPGFTENIPGTWRVDFLYNEVKVGEQAFQVGSSQPEIRVFEQSSNYIIIDGRTTPFDYGTVVQSATGPTMTFKVENHGYADLSISSVAVPTGFTITEPLDATIPAGTSDIFTVRLDSAVFGTKAGSIVITSNDASEGTFEFLVEGEVAAALLELAATSEPSAPAAFFFDDNLLGKSAEEADNPLRDEAPLEAAVASVLADNRLAVAATAEPADQALERESYHAHSNDEGIVDEVFDLLGDDGL